MPQYPLEIPLLILFLGQLYYAIICIVFYALVLYAEQLGFVF